MPIEEMNISLPPKVARFIRGKVKTGGYNSASEVVCEAVRHMQEVEAAKKDGTSLDKSEAGPLKDDHEAIRRAVRRGIKDVEAGRYEDLDRKGLKGLAKELVAASVKKLSGRTKVR